MPDRQYPRTCMALRDWTKSFDPCGENATEDGPGQLGMMPMCDEHAEEAMWRVLRKHEALVWALDRRARQEDRRA